MAKTVDVSYSMTGKDSTNITGSSQVLSPVAESDIGVVDFGTDNWTFASGVTARNIFPSGLPASTEISFWGYVVYDSAEPVATRNVSVTIDGAAAATKYGREFACIADTSLTLTTNAASSITVILTWRVES